MRSVPRGRWLHEWHAGDSGLRLQVDDAGAAPAGETPARCPSSYESGVPRAGHDARMDNDDSAARPTPYRMRRLTDTEMAELTALARQGTDGPPSALRALWDLILRDVEGLSLAEAAAAGTPGRWSVADYQIAADQAQALRHAMVAGRRRSTVYAIRMMWLNESPGEYDDDLA